MKRTAVKIITQMLVFGIAAAGGLTAAPFSYMTAEVADSDWQDSPVSLSPIDDEVQSHFESYEFALDSRTTLKIEGGRPRISRKAKDLESLYRIASHIGLGRTAVKVVNGMSAVRKMISFNPGGKRTRITSGLILDYDKIGIRSGITGFRGTNAQMEFSTERQRILISKNSNFVRRQVTIDFEEMRYTATVPLDDLSVYRLLSGLNIFGFFTKL